MFRPLRWVFTKLEITFPVSGSSIDTPWSEYWWSTWRPYSFSLWARWPFSSSEHPTLQKVMLAWHGTIGGPRIKQVSCNTCPFNTWRYGSSTNALISPQPSVSGVLSTKDEVLYLVPMRVPRTHGECYSKCHWNVKCPKCWSQVLPWQNF